MKYFGTAQPQMSSQQLTKEANAKLLFHIVEKEKRISRAQLAKKSGLSKSTVSVLTEEMIQKHLLLEAGAGESAPTGRKPILLEIDPSGMQIPCFSFKSTGLLFVLYDLKYEIIEQDFIPYGSKLKRKPEDQGKKYVYPSNEAVIDLFDTLLNKKSKKLCWDKVKAITISFAGSFDRGNNTFTSTKLGWAFDYAFINDVRSRFKDIPVLIGNVCAFLAFAEKKSNAHNSENLLYLHIGQGVGTGIILNNQTFTGESGISGEIGRQITTLSKTDAGYDYVSLEDRISENAILNNIREEISNGHDSVLMQMCGYNAENINIPMISDALNSDDAFTLDMIRHIAEEVASAISNTLCILGSMDVYIGGGIEKLGPKFLDMVREIFREIGYQRVATKTKLQYTRLPDNGECLGAAMAYVENQMQLLNQ